MDVRDKDATIASLDCTDPQEKDWHDELLQLNTDVAMDFVKQNLEISNLESYCNAKEELLNDLKLQVTMLEGEVNLKLQELDHLQEKERLLTDNLDTLNEMINSKEETEDILLENQRLLKSKRERHDKKWQQITDNYNSCLKELRENYNRNPLAQKRLNLQIEVQKQRIKLAVLLQKVQDQKESVKMLRDIRKRREQTKIIRFAEIMVEYYDTQKMTRQIENYEKKLKELNKHKPKDDIFKVPQHKSQPLINIHKTSFELPPLNLSAYQIIPQTFPSTTTNLKEGFKSNYCLKTNMDTVLSKLNTNTNKRSRQTLSPPKQPKQKQPKTLDLGQGQRHHGGCGLMSKSLPYITRQPETLSLPENKQNKNKDVPITTQDDIFEYISQDPNTIQQVALAKSPYFPSSASGSVSNSSQIIPSDALGVIQNNTLCLEVSAVSEVSEVSGVSGDDNEHDMDIMETSSFVSMEEFVSPPGPVGPEITTSSDVDQDQVDNNQIQSNSFLNNMFGGSSSQTKNNNAGFTFLNTPSRKKSSQNIFSMF